MRLFALAWLLFAPLCALGNPSPAEIEKAMHESMLKTPEFEFIRAEAEKLGVRAYLFGGSAASYAHYVKEDLLREAGDQRFSALRFDYDYTNIFRSTQDLDLVIDGSAEQAEALEKKLKAKFPHFLGDKANRWEVRPLREARGEKEAILGNPNFLNQHSDSHSTGLVEVTETPAGEAIVRDVKDWEGRPSRFLKDVSEGKIKYYWSPLHESTARFLEGKNPPILSAVRFLTKAFQYDLQISPEDEARVQEVVKAFDPAQLKNAYVKDWLEKNGKKLFLHAVNLEYAYKTLDKLGLRKKLIDLSGDTAKAQSLAWWLDKHPLFSGKVGEGKGKTAAEIASELKLDKIILAHETKDFAAYESITKDRAGELNVFRSRPDRVKDAHEVAVHGEGFYTKLGRKGARNTGYTIRMELDPSAREGADFERAGDYFILKNKAAVKVIPESINLSLLAYFEQLAKTGKGWDPDDLALVHAFKRKVGRSELLSKEELKAVKKIVEAELEKPLAFKNAPNVHVLREWLSLPEAVKDDDLTRKIVQKMARNDISFAWLLQALRGPHWVQKEKFLSRLVDVLDPEVADQLFMDLLSSPPWRDQPEVPELLVKWIKEGKPLRNTAAYWLVNRTAKTVSARPGWQAVMDQVMDSDLPLGELVGNVIYSQLDIPEREVILRRIAETGRGDKEIWPGIKSVEKLRSRPIATELVAGIVERGTQDKELAEFVLGVAPWVEDPRLADWARTIIGRGDEAAIKKLIRGALPVVPEPARTEIFSRLMDSRKFDSDLTSILGRKEFSRYPQATTWIRQMALRDRGAQDEAIGNVFNNHQIKATDGPIDWAKNSAATEVVNDAVNRGGLDESLAMLFRESEWIEHPDAPRWIRTIVQRDERGANEILRQFGVLSRQEWSRHPDFQRLIHSAGGQPKHLKTLLQNQSAASPSGVMTVLVNGVPCQVQFRIVGGH